MAEADLVQIIGEGDAERLVEKARKALTAEADVPATSAREVFSSNRSRTNRAACVTLAGKTSLG